MTAELSTVDLLTPEALAEPHPLLAELRERRPVAYTPAHNAWLVTRHDDLSACLADPRLSSDRVRPIYDTKLSEVQRAERAPTYDLLAHWMVFNDPPRHTRLRKLVKSTFTPRAVARLEPRIEEIVAYLLDGLDGRAEVDLIAEYSYPIPAAVIAELMGVPRSDVERFKAWSDAVMTLVFGVSKDAGTLAEAQAGLVELRDYLTDLARHYRARPAENLISELAAAADEDDRLSLEEIVATCVLLLFAGHETTTNLIGNGTRALIGHPEELAWLLAHPEGITGAVEEMLRFDGPSKLQVRRCVADIELRGETVPAGAQVFLLQAAANRDPRVFAEPDRLELSRNASRHVGFGWGLHYCLGAPIARLEGRVALDRLVRRFPGIGLGVGAPTWHPTLVSRGMSTFPVRLGPRSRA
jgi:cytochrome P450